MYTIEQIAEIRRVAHEAGLNAPDGFWSASYEDLRQICNGIGADWQSDKTRAVLTRACACVEATAAIHDFEYHNASLSEKAQKDADDRFLLNGIKETLHKSRSILSLKFVWNTRKVLLAYCVLRRLGSLAWASSFYNQQLTKGEQ